VPSNVNIYFRTPPGALRWRRGDGLLPSVERAGGGRFRLAELAALFRTAVMPAQVEVSTRSGYYSAWRGVVTWLLAHDSAYKGFADGLGDVGSTHNGVAYRRGVG